MMTENAIRDAFEHNDPAKYQDFFNYLHDAAKEKTTAELGTLTRRLLTAAADGALLCIGHIKGGFTDEV